MEMSLRRIGAVTRAVGSPAPGCNVLFTPFAVRPAAGHAASVGIIGPRKNSPAPGRFAPLTWGPDPIDVAGSARFLRQAP